MLNESDSEVFVLPHEISFRFSKVSYGRNIFVSEDGLTARRKDPSYDSGSGVYIATPLTSTFEFELEVTDCVKNSAGSLEIGVWQCPKGSYKHLDIPHKIGWANNDSCMWECDKVYNRLNGLNTDSFYGSINLQELVKGDRVGLKLSSNGNLSFLIDGKSQGIAATSVHNYDYDIYPVIGVGGNSCAIQITRAGWL